VAARSKDFVILACTVLIQITSVTDGRRDGQTDRQTPRRWQRRAKHSAFARKNVCVLNYKTFANMSYKNKSLGSVLRNPILKHWRR